MCPSVFLRHCCCAHDFFYPRGAVISMGDERDQSTKLKQAIDTYVWVVPVVLRLVTTVEEAVLVVAVVNGAPIVRVPENSLA